jgi:transposase
MRDYRIGCDAHKRYSQVEVQDDRGHVVRQARVYHEAGAVHGFFAQFPEGTPVALESVGNWYWIADEIEAAGCIPLLTHPAKAKVMMGHVNKTDKLDANGLATLLRIGSLPTVWLPPAEVRDERELPRTRMALCNMRTALKNRIHSTLAKYALSPEDGAELFSKKGQAWLAQAIARLPPETGRCLQQEVELLGSFNEQIQTLEARIREEIALTSSMQLLKTLPGVGDILAIVIDREVGTISRFPGSQNFSSYSGTTPRVSSSGGKTHLGHMRTESNQYLKWAFIEAGNVVAAHHAQPGWTQKHVSKIYLRTRNKKGHSIAVGAVARHLAESAFWILTKNEPYRDPETVPPRQG